MTAPRLARLMRARWWLVLLLIGVNVWLAGYLTDLRNRDIPDWEAVAGVVFAPRLGEIDDEAALARLQEGAEVAEEVNGQLLASEGGLLTPWDGAAIEVDETTRRLLFIGRADSRPAAEDIAVELRQNFVEEGFLNEARRVELDRQLEQILAELVTLRQRIDAATAPEPLNLEIELQRSLLTEQIAALRGRYAALGAQIFSPPIGRTVSGLQEEMELIRARLTELQAELASLPPPPDQPTAEEETSPEEELPVTIDRLQYEQLQGIYQELYLRRLEAQSEGGLEPVVVREASFQPVSKPFNQGLGALIALMAVLVGLVLTDRARTPVWTAADAEGTRLLQELPPRPLMAPRDRPWYLRTPPGERKAGIQRLRSLMEGVSGAPGLAVGISGISVASEDIHELAADLAVSLAISGRRVLLIDAHIDRPSRLVEFGNGQHSLSELLRIPLDRREEMAEIYRLRLTEAAGVVPNLHAVPAGRNQIDSADVLSRPQLEILLEVARDLFDTVVVAGADASQPSVHVLSQRVEAMMVLGAAGQTSTAALERVTQSLRDRRARVLGLVLLTRPTGTIRRLVRRFQGSSSKHGRRRDGERLTPTPDADLERSGERRARL